MSRLIPPKVGVRRVEEMELGVPIRPCLFITLAPATIFVTLGKCLDFSVPWVGSSEENRELIGSPLVH